MKNLFNLGLNFIYTKNIKWVGFYTFKKNIHYCYFFNILKEIILFSIKLLNNDSREFYNVTKNIF